MSPASGSASQEDRDRVRALVRDVPDFPRAGITFKDITPLLADPAGLRSAVTALADSAPEVGVDLVAGVEARGFIVGTPLALALGAGFLPVRKAGRLPGAVVRESYALEYGEAVIEVHADAVRPGQRVLVVDDVLATGGTARAACALLERLGAQVVGVRFLLELAGLDGRAALTGRDVAAVLEA